VEYERDLARVGRSVDEALARVPDEPGVTIGPEVVAQLADDLAEASAKLSDLDPPDEDAARAQKQLQRGLDGVAAAFDELARDLAELEGDEAKAERFVEFASDPKIESAFDDIARAQQKYAQAGYRVFRSTRTSG
jgi:hypothetical protein